MYLTNKFSRSVGGKEVFVIFMSSYGLQMLILCFILGVQNVSDFISSIVTCILLVPWLTLLQYVSSGI